jgi:DNA-binding NtrC family response regulator
MSGPVLVRKALEAYPNIKVVFMSGHEIQDFPDALALSGSSFLQKPFTFSGLIQAISEVCRLKT